MAHSAPIFDESVRQEDTRDRRAAADSVKKLRAELVESGLEGAIIDIESTVLREVEDGIAFALDAPYPQRDTLYTGLYA